MLFMLPAASVATVTHVITSLLGILEHINPQIPKGCAQVLVLFVPVIHAGKQNPHNILEINQVDYVVH